MEESRNRLTPRGSEKADILRALAARCEGEAPSFALECEIGQAVESPGSVVDTPDGWFINRHGTALSPQWDRYKPQRFTASRDAAAALMPEGMTVNVVTGGSQGKLTYVEVFVSEDIHWCDAQAPTEAQARTAAALYAMADLEESAQSSKLGGEANSPTLSKAGA